MTPLAQTFLEFAVQAAKSRGHGAVEARHVVFAVCRHFPQRDGMTQVLTRVQECLLPNGTAFDTPKPTPDALDFLAQCSDEAGAVHAVKEWLGSESTGKRSDGRQTHPNSGGGGMEVMDRPKSEPMERTSAPPSRTKETAADVLKELEALEGLESVKQRVRQISAVLEANRVRSSAGLPVVEQSLHLVFTGNPGTGKSTVARIMARLYAAMGAIQGARFEEAKREDLVEGYIGQTALKTRKVIQAATPGVLFIDEAYTLSMSDHRSDFGYEAIATLLAEMENRRKDLAVIVAGYPLQMDGFIHSNPGLSSRFKTVIDFPDYGPDQLVSMFRRLALEKKLEVSTRAVEVLPEVFSRAAEGRHFGNARFVRNLFEQAYSRRATEAMADGRVELDEVRRLELSDILEAEKELRASKAPRIGFGG